MPREGDGNDLHGKCEEDKKANEPAGAAPAGKSDVHIQRQNTKECKYCGPKTFDEVSEGGKCRFRCFMKSYAILETDESALNEDNLREATKSFVKENEKATAEAVVNSLNKCIDVSDKTKTSINRAFEIHTCSFPELKRACKTCGQPKKEHGKGGKGHGHGRKNGKGKDGKPTNTTSVEDNDDDEAVAYQADNNAQ